MSTTTATPSRSEVLLESLRSGSVLSGREELELVMRLAVPGALAQLSYILMSYIDASMVGHLGANASAAVGLVSTTLWLCYGLGGAIITGFSVQTAQRIGAKENDAARSLLRQSLTTVLGLTSLIALTAASMSSYLPGWLGADMAIAPQASEYFLIMAVLLPLTFLGWLSGAMLRATGDMKTPSFFGILMCVLDVVFNALLIFPTSHYTVCGLEFTVPGADLGINGAALGTGLAELVTGAAMVWLLINRTPALKLTGTRGSWLPQWTTLCRAARIAAPVAGERAMMTGAQIVSTMIVAPLGIVSVAAHSLAITAESLAYMPGYGMGEAASTLVAQSVGARRADLASRLAWKCVTTGMIVMTTMGVVLWFTAPALMGIMTNDQAVIDLGAKVLRIEAWAEPMFAAAIVCYNAFIGTGDTVKPALTNLSTMWLVRIALASILAPTWGLSGVWFAMATELCVRGAIFLWRMKTGAWLARVKARAQKE